MEIGESIKYIRHSTDGVSEGAGRVKAIALDPESRAIVQVVDDKEIGEDGTSLVFNTFANTINPSDDFRKAFENMVVEVETIMKAANEEIKKTTDAANETISGLHNELLGSPIVFDDSV